MSEQSGETRAERIAAARAALAERYAADPEGVQRFNARMAVLQDARKRERQRVDHLVLDRPRPVKKKRVGKRAGHRKPKTITVPVALAPGIEEAMQIRERWSHKHNGTPETWEQDGKHSDALLQMERNGTIDREQLEWAAEIANVHRSIESDVAVSVASLEARVDQSRSNRAAVVEGVSRIRKHLAYTRWRGRLPDPKALVLDMIVGDAIGYTVAAKRYGVHNRKAKRLLIAALDDWPECVDFIHRAYSDDEIKNARDAA